MSQAPKDTRTPAEKARDNRWHHRELMHEGYVPNPEDEAIHQRAELGEITTEQSSQFFANAPLSGSERRWSASASNPASAYDHWRESRLLSC